MSAFLDPLDWSFPTGPANPDGTIAGLGRKVLAGPAQGAVHTELAAGRLEPGGWLGRHVHSFEESLYLLAGELVLELDGRPWRLVAGDFALIPIGTWHLLANLGSEPVRWVSMNSPVRRTPADPRRDTFFRRGAPDLAQLAGAGVPAFGSPTVRGVGHYTGTPPQAEAFGIVGPARGRAPAGLDTAVLAYSGISVKMLIDRGLGADHLTVFTVDYEVGGAAQSHDHPFEEAYLILEGEVEAVFDGETRRLGPGDVAFAAVGVSHAFYNDGPARVRWLETQAPQPPGRHAYRWDQTWAAFDPSRAP
ncbi:MAG TPA: cupin domain-containing protein [Candidatus Limnocylindrales bacterium]|nr:cupin domain-containing protein [Candidatus Limnocylindrales bacterium]